MESIRQLSISDIVTTPLVVSESTPVSKIVGILKEKDAYEVFTQAKTRVGMIMIRDILKSWNVAGEKAESLVYTAPRLPPRAPLSEAARLLMQNRIRSLPVVEGEKLFGCVTATSIIKTIPSNALDKYRAQDIMTPRPASLAGDDKVSKARSLMLRRKIDHLPVSDENKLKGMLTSSQIVYDLYQQIQGVPGGQLAMVDEVQRRLEIPIKTVMDSLPLTSAPSDKIALVLKRMLDANRTYCLITQVEEVQGVVTYRDFMKLIAEEIVRPDTPVYIVGLPDDPFEAEQTRTKFIRSVETLRRTAPYIEEARAVIRTREGPERERRRYEVTVTLITPKRNFAYSSMGFELANIFDEVQSHLKAMTAARPRRGRRSPRLQETGE